MNMKQFQVFLMRDYAVRIRAENENKAREYVQDFVSIGSDDSTEKDRKQYGFEIQRINTITNDAFEVEEIPNG
jgi:hypothetical protein